VTHRPLILNVEPDRYSEDARAVLRSCGEVRERAGLSRAELLASVGDADVLLTRLAHRIDGEVFGRAPHLRAVVTPTTGLNHVDLEAAASRGVEVLSLRGETAFLESVTATAELTWGLLICLARRLPEAGEGVRSGLWDRDAFRGRELRGKTLGVVGLGRLGRMVARYGTAFQMRVLACDPRPGEVPPGVELVGLERLLAESDAVTVHAALTESSRGLIGAAEFARIKPGTLFVNTARGELVDEAALLEALAQGRLAGAGLDVLGGEPFAGPEGLRAHPLWQWARDHANLVLTPHIGGATLESMAATEVFMAEKLRRWLVARYGTALEKRP
jgi:D-3-phosphoglycerate dehydrogenase